MDVDISDILASVSRPVPAARYDPTTPSTPYYDDNTAFTDHQLSTRSSHARPIYSHDLPAVSPRLRSCACASPRARGDCRCSKK